MSTTQTKLLSAAAVKTILGFPSNAIIAKKVILPSVDTDFDDLTEDMTTYTFSGDVPSGVTLTNSPILTPSGGFSVRVIKEGHYLRQIATFYHDSTSIYMRCQIYRSGGPKWDPWVRIRATAINE